MSIAAWAALIAGLWAIINGLLHDIFVLRSDYGKKYDRELLRLLMDGHILLTCGAVQVFACNGVSGNSHWGYYMAGIAAISMLVYCVMIWPFLKSLGTMAVNLALVVILLLGYMQLL